MLENALGLYLCVWGVVTILFIIASQKSSVALLCTLAVLTVDLFTLWVESRHSQSMGKWGKDVYRRVDDRAAGHFIQGQKCFIAGGVMGIVSRTFSQNFFPYHQLSSLFCWYELQIVAILGAYIGLAGLLTDDFSPFRIPVGNLTPKDY